MNIMKRSLTVISATLLILILGALIANVHFATEHSLTNPQSSKMLKLVLREGMHLVYELEPYGSIPKLPSFIINFHLNSIMKLLNLTRTSSDYNFYVQLYNDYEELTAKPHVVLNVSKLCEIVSERLLVEVKVNNIESGKIAVILSLIFINGYVRCGSNFKPLPVIDGKWIKVGNDYVASFSRLILSRNFVILLDSFDVIDGCGEHYGEWIFWIRKQDLQQKHVLLLYSLIEPVQMEYPFNGSDIKGLANLILLNTSQKAPYEYRVGNYTFPNRNQIYTKGSSILNVSALPNEKTLYNVSYGMAKRIIDKIKKCENLRIIAKLFPIIHEPETRKLILFKDIIPSIVNLSNKPWSYISNLTCRCRIATINGTSVRICSKVRGIRYYGNLYVAFINDGLEEISYSTSGLLLYIKLHVNNGNLYYFALPYLIVKGFKITAQSRVAGSKLLIKLIGIKAS